MYNVTYHKICHAKVISIRYTRVSLILKLSCEIVRKCMCFLYVTRKSFKSDYLLLIRSLLKKEYERRDRKKNIIPSSPHITVVW